MLRARFVWLEFCSVILLVEACLSHFKLPPGDKGAFA